MKQVSRIKSKQPRAFVELGHDATELLNAIKSAAYIETKLQNELAAFDRSSVAMNRLKTKRRALLRRPTIKTNQLTSIEQSIDVSQQLMDIAEVQVGKLAVAKKEILEAIADLQVKIAERRID